MKVHSAGSWRYTPQGHEGTLCRVMGVHLLRVMKVHLLRVMEIHLFRVIHKALENFFYEKTAKEIIKNLKL